MDRNNIFFVLSTQWFRFTSHRFTCQAPSSVVQTGLMMLKPFYNLPTPYIIYIDFPPLFPHIMAISARRRLTNKSWLLTEPHASHAMRATRRFPFVQAKNNKQVKLSITGTDNNTYIKECCRIGLARDRTYRVCTLSLQLN
jgi:hypothetical protein